MKALLMIVMTVLFLSFAGTVRADESQGTVIDQILAELKAQKDTAAANQAATNARLASMESKIDRLLGTSVSAPAPVLTGTCANGTCTIPIPTSLTIPTGQVIPTGGVMMAPMYGNYSMSMSSGNGKRCGPIRRFLGLCN